MVELILVASILVSMNYTIMQALMLASMFLPVLLAMKYFLPQVKWERTHKEITGIVCLFLSFLVLEYLLLMCCHTWIKSYMDEMPSVLLNPIFLTLLLAVLFVTDTAIGKQLDKRFGKTPSCITFYSDRKSVTLLTEQILYVGNHHKYDVLGAKKTGMRTAWLILPHLGWLGKKSKAADFTFWHYNQLDDWFFGKEKDNNSDSKSD